MGVYSKQHRLRARFDGKDLAFGCKRIVVSEEVRHLWNNQIAEPDPKMDHRSWLKVEPSMMSAFHPRIVWRTSGFVRA